MSLRNIVFGHALATGYLVIMRLILLILQRLACNNSDDFNLSMRIGIDHGQI